MDERRRRRRALVGWLSWPDRRHRRASARPAPSALARARGRQNGVLLAVLLCLHAVLWLLVPSWWWRGAALLATAALWPVLVVLVFDRRASR
jgi:Flp pilus assembly protein TadB